MRVIETVVRNLKEIFLLKTLFHGQLLHTLVIDSLTCEETLVLKKVDYLELGILKVVAW